MTTAYLTSSLLMALLVVSASAPDETQLKNKDLNIALQEMQGANYYAFVMLINMVKDKIPPNSTFLMPNDKTLSKVSIAENEVLEFLSRHSIPLPLLFDDMKHFPTGTLVPTNQDGYMLRISNSGKGRLCVNNAQLTNINICTVESSFRCHGINQVLEAAAESMRTPPAVCPSAGPLPAPFESPLPFIHSPGIAPSPVVNEGSRKSSSSNARFWGIFSTMMSSMILSGKLLI